REQVALEVGVIDFASLNRLQRHSLFTNDAVNQARDTRLAPEVGRIGDISLKFIGRPVFEDVWAAADVRIGVEDISFDVAEIGGEAVRGQKAQTTQRTHGGAVHIVQDNLVGLVVDDIHLAHQLGGGFEDSRHLWGLNS